jgi:hypothetical protein
VRVVTTIEEMKRRLERDVGRSTVLGFFGSADIAEGADDGADGSGYSIDPWGQFQAAADSLRG